MKQYPIQKEWNGLSDEHKGILRKRFEMELYSTDYRDNVTYLTIGKMIEFLGDEWLIAPESSMDRKLGIYSIVWNKKDELCDELWEAVKYKLNN